MNLTTAARIQAPAAAVWKYIGDYSSADLAAGIFLKTEVTGEGVGALRKFYLPEHLGGGFVEERCETYDAERMRYSYSMTDTGPLPYGDYLGELRVVPAGPHACSIIGYVTIVPVTDTPERCGLIYLNNMELLFSNIRRLCEKSPS